MAKQKPAFALEAGDRINIGSLNPDSHIDTEASEVTVLDVVEDDYCRGVGIAIGNSEGYLELIGLNSGRHIEITEHTDEINRTAEIVSDPTEPFVEVGVGLQRTGNWVRTNDDDEDTEFAVLNTFMTNKWHYFLALGRDGEFQKLISRHDSGYLETAPGWTKPEGWKDYVQSVQQ